MIKGVNHAHLGKEYPEYVGHFLLEFYIIKKFQKKMTNVFSVLLAFRTNLVSFRTFQTSPIPQTSSLLWTFFAISYSNTALVHKLCYHV